MLSKLERMLFDGEKLPYSRKQHTYINEIPFFTYFHKESFLSINLGLLKGLL